MWSRNRERVRRENLNGFPFRFFPFPCIVSRLAPQLGTRPAKPVTLIFVATGATWFFIGLANARPTFVFMYFFWYCWLRERRVK
jgi:hypothetical protein